MLINKFNPAFVGDTGVLPDPFVGKCPGYVTQPYNQIIHNYNTTTSTFSPADIRLSFKITGESPISVSIYTGATENGSYSVYSTGNNAFFVTGATLQNTNIWYKAEIENDVAGCPAVFSSGIHVVRNEFSDNNYTLNLYTAGFRRYDSLTPFLDADCCTDKRGFSLYLRPYYEVAGFPNAYSYPGGTCDWYGIYTYGPFSIYGNYVYMTGLSDYTFDQFVEKPSLVDDIKNWGKENYPYGYYGYYGDNGIINYCNSLGQFGADNKRIIEEVYGTGVVAITRNQLIFPLDANPGPHNPTGYLWNQNEYTWGTGDYFIRGVSQHGYLSNLNCIYGAGGQNTIECDSYTRRFDAYNTDSVVDEFYETGSDVYRIGSSLPNSGHPMVYNPDAYASASVITMESGKTDHVVYQDWRIDCSYCAPAVELDFVYLYGGTNLPGYITGKYSLLSGWGTLADLITSGLFDIQEFVSNEGALVDSNVRSNFCNCPDNSEDVCTEIVTPQSDLCNTKWGNAASRLGGILSQTDLSNEGYLCYTYPNELRISEQNAYFAGYGDSSSTTLVGTNPGVLTYLGVAGRAETFSDGSGSTTTVNPVVIIDSRNYSVYYDVCSSSMKQWCNGTEYDYDDTTPCHKTYTPFEGSVYGAIGEEGVVECGNPGPTDNGTTCGDPPDDIYGVYQCSEFGYTDTDKPMRIALSKRYAVETNDGNCVSANAFFYSTDFYDVESIP